MVMQQNVPRIALHCAQTTLGDCRPGSDINTGQISLPSHCVDEPLQHLRVIAMALKVWTTSTNRMNDIEQDEYGIY